MTPAVASISGLLALSGRRPDAGAALCPAALPANTREIPPTFFIMLGLLIAGVLAVGVVMLFIRRRALSGDRDRPATAMEEFRRMRADGRLTAEEYDAVRRAMASRVAGKVPARGAGDSKARPKLPPPPGADPGGLGEHENGSDSGDSVG